MSSDALQPDNTTILLVDYGIGFANILRSHDLPTHQNNVIGLAKAAKLFGGGLVVTNGAPELPQGPLYPELLAVLDGHPVIVRPGFFNVFRDENVAKAIRDTGNRNVALAGISTEGCVLQSVLGGLREGYNMYLVVDATASVTLEAHTVSVQRMVQAGAVPVTWYSLAGEFLGDHRSPLETDYREQLMMGHQPAMKVGSQQFRATLENAAGR